MFAKDKMEQLVKMEDCVTNNSFISDAKIILRFLSVCGIPTIDNFRARKYCKIFKEILLCILTICYICISLLLSVYRFEFLHERGNLLSTVNGITTITSSMLLRLFLIFKVKKLNKIFNSFCKLMIRNQMKSRSNRKIIMIGCISSFLLPVFVSQYNNHVLRQSNFYEWPPFKYLLPTSLERAIVTSFIDIGYAIDEYTFPFISTILLIFIYFSYNRFVLTPFLEQLKITYRNPTLHSIRGNLDMCAKVKRMWMQIEDFTSVSAFFLFGMLFSSALYVVGKAVSIDQGGLSAISKYRAVVCIAQMIMLCAFGSQTVNKWQEVRLYVQETFRFYSKSVNKEQNKDILPLVSLLDCTKMDLSFTCFGILNLDWSLLLKTIMTIVTFGSLMV